MKADNPQWITQLKSRVNQHQVPPPNAEELWAAIAKQQKRAPAPLVLIPWYRRPASWLSVAAALALLVGIGILMQTPDRPGITSISNTPIVASIPTESATKIMDEPSQAQSPEKKTHSAQTRTKKRAPMTVQAGDLVASVEPTETQAPTVEDVVEVVDLSIEKQENAASQPMPLPSEPQETRHKITTKHHRSTLLPEASISISLYGNGTPRMHRPIAHPQEVILMSSYSLRSTSAEEAPKLVEYDLDVLLQKGAARFTHKTPINVGVQVALPLSSRISIESGIGYHYLASTISGGQDNALKGTQSLHYIGMPVQLSYRLLQSNQVSFYAQAGCEAAVCVGRIVLFDNPMLAQLTLSESYKTPLDKMQWSLLGGFGINYNVSRSFDLFVKPQIAYHIDNKSQVPSVYKDKPFDYSITAGLRFVLRN